MNNYKLLAWLPGEIVFYAQNESGEVGMLSPHGFRAAPANYVNSAINKWGFMNLKALNLTASPSQLSNIANHLATLA